MPTIFIDNKPFEVKAGKNLLEACLALGIDLPYFCWHPALGSVGSCRQCAVKSFKDESDTRGRLVMSCMENVKEGLRISVNDTSAREFRAQVIEWLMTNHPHDCPVCDEGGSCHLQDMTVMTGHDYRRFRYKKRTYNNQYLGPFIHHEMNRCIQCYRCVRFYRDYAGGKDLNVFAAHHHVYFGREKDGVLESPFSGNLAEVCPTGVFTDNTLREHYTRKWDLTSAPSVCQHCSVGCNIIAGERYGSLRQIGNRYNGHVNGYFLCDRGRFGYEFVNSDNRITRALINKQETADELELLAHLEKLLSGSRLIGIGSARASMESNFSLMQLVGEHNFYRGVSENEVYLENRIVDILQSGSIHSPSLSEIQEADAILILGEDIWNTAPMMALALRQAITKSASGEALQHTPLPAWHDLAVREMVQDEKGFLANITLASSPLNEMASFAMQAAPDNIARLGFAIAHIIKADLPQVPDAGEFLLSRAGIIANALQQARRPLIISGVSCCNESIIRAAFDIAASLKNEERKAALSYVMPECNSMGLAMMYAPSFESAASRVKHDPDITAIILENDIYRNIPAPMADAFFSRCKNIIVLDSLRNFTTARAHVAIPAATFAEADGTLINNEGRAQQFFQVFAPANHLIRESWKWLWKMKALRTISGNGGEHHPDDLLVQLEKMMPQYHGISQVAPRHDFRINGQPIAREPHRYSGRTAMMSHLAVSERRPPQDLDSPLGFTMEGFQGVPPAPLIPFFWAPGWNSVQSVSKYQEEPGGSLRGGDPGIRLFEEKTKSSPGFFKDVPEAFTARADKWLLLPQYHVFGSGELSAYTKAIQELTPLPYIGLSEYDAEQLDMAEGVLATVQLNEMEYFFPVKIMESLPNGIVMMPAGLQGMPVPEWGSWIKLLPEGRPITNSKVF